MSVQMFKEEEKIIRSCWFPPERCQALLADGWRFTEEAEVKVVLLGGVWEHVEETDEAKVVDYEETPTKELRGKAEKINPELHKRATRKTLIKVLEKADDNQD